MTAREELLETRRQLLSRRNMTTPNGQPLFSYRFDLDEYGRLQAVLKRAGPYFKETDDGCMLFVAYVAEWIRRDREGGHWDWKRPLADIGITYGVAGARLSHPEVVQALRTGLRHWRRPPPGGEGNAYILAAVRECGFPAAAIKRGDYLEAWLSGALSLIDRGFDAEVAVEREAWRVPDQLAGVLLDNAKALCRCIADFRKSFRTSKAADLGLDPVSFLDSSAPDWRTSLPIPIEDRQARTLIEELVRARRTASSALLAVERFFEASTSGWRARAQLELEGVTAERDLPAALRASIGGHSRLQLKPRGRLAEVYPRSIGTLERETTDDDAAQWRLIKRVNEFQPICDLATAIVIGVEGDGAFLSEFAPEGGDAVHADAFALKIDKEDPGAARRLTFLTVSNARVRDAWIAIGVRESVSQCLSIEGDRFELGQSSDGRFEFLAVNGSATFTQGDDRISWSSGAETEEFERLTFDGPRLRRSDEPIFLGEPTVVSVGSATRSQQRLDQLSWRPIGRREWRMGGPILGRIEFADIDNGSIKARGAAAIAPKELTLGHTLHPRELHVSGLSGAEISARSRLGGAALPTRRTGHDAATIDLSASGAGEIIVLELLWAETSLTIPLRDPTTPHALIGPDGRVSLARERLCVHGLEGWRVFSSTPTELHFDLSPESGRSVSVTTKIDGEAPLIAHQMTIKGILASATSDEALNAAARLEWSGGSERIADVAWYPQKGSLLATAQSAWEGLSLLRPTSVLASDGDSEMAKQRLLQTLREQGGGPCLIYPTDGIRAVGRPFAQTVEPVDQRTLTPLQCIALVSNHGSRKQQLEARFQELDDWERDEFLYLRGMIYAARGRVPFASFDALRPLAPRHDAAVRTLALCDDVDQRSAVLSLQEELPFLWSATSVPSWTSALRTRRKSLRDLLGSGAEHLALDVIASSLTDIVNLEPSLSGHASLISRALMEDEDPQNLQRSTGFLRLAKRLVGIGSGEAMTRALHELIGRHAEGRLWPQLDLARALGTEGGMIGYTPAFRDVVAAPHVAALAALGQASVSEDAILGCRQARMFDTEYFDQVVPHALMMRSKGNTWFGRTPG